MSEEAKMQRCILMLATSALILAYGAATASAQQGPMLQPQGAQTQGQGRPLQGAQTPRGGVENYLDDNSEITGWHPGLGWRRYRGWGPENSGVGMMRRGEPGAMQSGMMMRMQFALMDSDGDGTVSLQEFQAAHERIFKAMDANKDGKLTLEEIQAFMRGTSRPAPRQ